MSEKRFGGSWHISCALRNLADCKVKAGDLARRVHSKIWYSEEIQDNHQNGGKLLKSKDQNWEKIPRRKNSLISVKNCGSTSMSSQYCSVSVLQDDEFFDCDCPVSPASPVDLDEEGAIVVNPPLPLPLLEFQNGGNSEEGSSIVNKQPKKMNDFSSLGGIETNDHKTLYEKLQKYAEQWTALDQSDELPSFSGSEEVMASSSIVNGFCPDENDCLGDGIFDLDSPDSGCSEGFAAETLLHENFTRENSSSSGNFAETNLDDCLNKEHEKLFDFENSGPEEESGFITSPAENSTTTIESPTLKIEVSVPEVAKILVEKSEEISKLFDFENSGPEEESGFITSPAENSTTTIESPTLKIEVSVPEVAKILVEKSEEIAIPCSQISSVTTVQPGLYVVKDACIQTSNSELSTSPKDKTLLHRLYTCTNDDDDDDGADRKKLLRNTSLKSGKTPPGTPGRKKIVRFADALGLDLEAVRHIAGDEDFPHIPSSAFRDLKLPPEENIHIHRSFQRNLQSSVVPSPYSISLTPEFSQPSCDPNFFEKLKTQKLCLENVVIASMTAHAFIKVLNMSYEKFVFVRYTTTEWATSDEIMATYVLGSSDGMCDRFSLTLYVPQMIPGQRVILAIRYLCGGVEYWDNNGGKNYILTCQNVECSEWLHHFI